MRFTAIVLGIFLMGASFNSLSAQESSVEEKNAENIKLVCRLIDGGLSEKSIESYDEVLSDDIILHGPAIGQETIGVSNLKELDNKLSRGLENIYIIVEEVFAQNDKIVVFWTVHAERENRHVTVAGHGIYRITDGKICEIWQTWDKVNDPL